MAKAKRSKNIVWSGLLVITLVIAGIFFYVSKSTQRVTINEIGNGEAIPGEAYILLVDPTPPPSASESGKPVIMEVGKQVAFNLLAKPRVDMLFSDITGLEGKMLFDPTMIQIDDFQSMSLPVAIRKWEIKKIDDTHAELTFSYGTKPVVGKISGEICKTETGVCAGDNGLCVSYFNGCEKARKCTAGSEKTSCSIPTETLLWVKYHTLKYGETKIEFPAADLKLATYYGPGNSYFREESRLSMVVIAVATVASPTPTPKSIQREDLNKDGKVNLLDYNILLRYYGMSGNNIADLDDNKLVDIFDYSIMIKALRYSV
ncbi:hypothetical protein COT87_00715 [Candidatus Collierbacteria bacterium CG10_big_fil_rev_8_21_14_0_10_44_9]|uniref:Dockerin domain-containing protein n=1 Tax=Candidatus Collierbacteria bacterium CG10_big_fil_rev_8_21_14_0_10_44_9 TaxID=1974535 RepID=A0A2H0VJB5_9BACT|nr:MAG: hypothetical protein COT87_00715 [Candidatus Collierbacteria bacterium CG10_big_fil_rev_8_21_14_0_10_44_9]